MQKEVEMLLATNGRWFGAVRVLNFIFSLNRRASAVTPAHSEATAH
jgi:hypothetical protein